MDLALDQREMHLPSDRVLIGQHPERPELGIEQGIGDPFDGFFVLHPVADQVGDGADFHLVLGGEHFQIGPPRHVAVLVEDFDDHRRRFQPGQPGQVAAGFGVAGAGQHAAGLGHQREDVAGLHQILGPGVGPHGGADGVGAVVGGNAGGHALGGFDGNGEVGGVGGGVVLHHQRQAQLLAAFAGQGQADQAAPVAGHEIDVLGTDQRGGHQQVAFVFPVLVVHDDDHFALPEVGEDFVDAVECHGYFQKPCSRRSASVKTPSGCAARSPSSNRSR